MGDGTGTRFRSLSTPRVGGSHGVAARSRGVMARSRGLVAHSRGVAARSRRRVARSRGVTARSRGLAARSRGDAARSRRLGARSRGETVCAIIWTFPLRDSTTPAFPPDTTSIFPDHCTQRPFDPLFRHGPHGFPSRSKATLLPRRWFGCVTKKRRREVVGRVIGAGCPGWELHNFGSPRMSLYPGDTKGSLPIPSDLAPLRRLASPHPSSPPT